MKIKLKSTLYFDFCFASKLIWSRHSHTNVSWNYLEHYYFGSQCYKVFGLKFSYISKVLDKDKNFGLQIVLIDYLTIK